MKTREEIESLKQGWINDPIWDIEDTDGFEEYRDELIQFHNEKRKEWDGRWNERLLTKAEHLGAPGNVKLAEYVLQLERHIDILYTRMEDFANRLYHLEYPGA